MNSRGHVTLECCWDLCKENMRNVIVMGGIVALIKVMRISGCGFSFLPTGGESDIGFAGPIRSACEPRKKNTVSMIVRKVEVNPVANRRKLFLLALTAGICYAVFVGISRDFSAI